MEFSKDQFHPSNGVAECTDIIRKAGGNVTSLGIIDIDARKLATAGDNVEAAINFLIKYHQYARIEE